MHSSSLALLLALFSAFVYAVPQEDAETAPVVTCDEAALAYRDWFYLECEDLMDVANVLDSEFFDTLTTTCAGSCGEGLESQYATVEDACAADPEVMNKVNMLAIVGQFACSQESEEFCSQVIPAKVESVPDADDSVISNEAETEDDSAVLDPPDGEEDAMLFKRQEESVEEFCSPCVTYLQSLVSAFSVPAESGSSEGSVGGGANPEVAVDPAPESAASMMKLTKRRNASGARTLRGSGRVETNFLYTSFSESEPNAEARPATEPVAGKTDPAQKKDMDDEETLARGSERIETNLLSGSYNEDDMMWAGINPENLLPVLEQLQDLTDYCWMQASMDEGAFSTDDSAGDVENTSAEGSNEEEFDESSDAAEESGEEDEDADATGSEADEEAASTDDADKNTDTKESSAFMLTSGASLITLLASLFAF